MSSRAPHGVVSCRQGSPMIRPTMQVQKPVRAPDTSDRPNERGGRVAFATTGSGHRTRGALRGPLHRRSMQ